jgi:hypothetical protein
MTSERRIRQIIREELAAVGVRKRPTLIERMRTPDLRTILLNHLRNETKRDSFAGVMRGRFAGSDAE